MSGGRPSVYSKKLAVMICEQLAAGISLRKICRKDAMPGKTTVFRWLLEHDDFRDQYALARQHQADTLFDECLDIADDGSNDWMTDNEEEGGVKYNGDATARSRLRIDTRKWMAGKLNAKKYGEKVDEDDGKVLTVQLVQFAPTDGSR